MILPGPEGVAAREWDADSSASLSELLIYAAGLIAGSGGCARVAAVPPEGFRLLLFQIVPGTNYAAPSFPYPGLFLQASTGWFYVVADPRLRDKAIIRDPVTGLEWTVKGWCS